MWIWVKVVLSMQCVDLGEGGGEHAMCGSGLGEQFWRLLGGRVGSSYRELEASVGAKGCIADLGKGGEGLRAVAACGCNSLASHADGNENENGNASASSARNDPNRRRAVPVSRVATARRWLWRRTHSALGSR